VDAAFQVMAPLLGAEGLEGGVLQRVGDVRQGIELQEFTRLGLLLPFRVQKHLESL